MSATLGKSTTVRLKLVARRGANNGANSVHEVGWRIREMLVKVTTRLQRRRLAFVQFKDRSVAMLPDFCRYTPLLRRRQRVPEQHQVKLFSLASCHDVQVTRGGNHAISRLLQRKLPHVGQARVAGCDQYSLLFRTAVHS